VQGQPINAKGVVDGDALTANDNPALSTFAHASLDVNKSLVSLEGEVSTNLGKSGFMRDGSPGAPYYETRVGDYSASVSGGKYDTVLFRYIKDDRAIRITYKLDKAYMCPKEYVCVHTPKSKPTDSIYPMNEFGTVSVTRMNINFSDKSSDYHSGY
jgi:hypothetical protein